MIEFYTPIKWLHVAAVMVSGGLFFIRGLALYLNQRWPMTAPLRYLSYGIDTVLLTAALMLATMLHQYPFVQTWLTVKVAFLFVYIVLGSYALKRGSTRQRRFIFWLIALAVYLFIISVARAYHPLGVFTLL